MSAIEIESSEQSSEPVELFDIQISGLNLALTSYNKDYLFEGKTYKAVQIKRNALRIDTNSFDDRVKVTVPLRSQIGQQILNSELESTTALTITKTFVGTTEKYILWSGTIVQKEIDNYYLHIVCLPTAYMLEKTGNRGQYTRVCRHVLYSRNCGVNKSLFSSQNKIMDAKSSLVYLQGKIDNSYAGGIIKLSNGVSRMILSVNAEDNTIRLISPFIGDIKGMNVTLYKGCDKSIECCKQRFRNFENYGGFPFIPVRNIFTKSVS